MVGDGQQVHSTERTADLSPTKTSHDELRDQPSQPNTNRDCVLVGEPEMVALQMAADGTPIVPNVSPVMGEARGRGVAHL